MACGLSLIHIWTSFENDADIKRLAIEHIEEKHGADSLTGETL